MKDYSKGKAAISGWFHSQEWTMQDFQTQVMDHYLQNKNGLLNAPTGTGKTYALFMPVLAKFLFSSEMSSGLKLIWISPLKALTEDIRLALQKACDDTGIGWTVGIRTGDTSAAERILQKKQMPDVLLTTPESLHLLFAQKDHERLFRSLDTVIVDEWHELLGSKRGVQTELALSRLRVLKPELLTWGISATIGNLNEALVALCGLPFNRLQCMLVDSKVEKRIEISSVMPDEITSFPWAGHLGITLLDKVIPVIRKSRSTLIFTNTRSQTEIWYRKIIENYPEFAGLIALHHGSLSKDVRSWVESALNNGSLKAVVCTSSLDLGVDFRPVETIIQIGSPKSIARFIQRAGRSGHQPGSASRIYFLPTHSLELIEAASLRDALAGNVVESRTPMVNNFDVLIQYMITRAVGGGYIQEELFREVRGTYCYQVINEDEWQWLTEFITIGGKTLHAYEEFHKAVLDNGMVKVVSRKTASRHRMNIGTIVSDSALKVRLNNGKFLGTIEESFLSHYKPGDVFWFAGRNLELIHIRSMTATVRKSPGKKGSVPRWMGGRLSLSSQFSAYIRDTLCDASYGRYSHPELCILEPLFEIQQDVSHIPRKNEFLIEQLETEDGCHLFFYPFEGRQVHEGLAALIAWRISRHKPISFSIAMNDYGFELLSDQHVDIGKLLDVADLFHAENLRDEITESLNSTEMARRKFRDIAGISGMIFKGFPGSAVKTKHLQMSSGLLFDVLKEHEPDSLLIRQSYEEVFDQQLEEHRLRLALNRIKDQRVVVTTPVIPTPFCFPILVDRLREQMTTESLKERINKMTLEYS